MSFRWWLRLQLGFALAGAATWLIGVVMKQDFIAGLGLGLLVGGLALRIGRRAAQTAERRGPAGGDSQSTGEER